MTHWIAEAVRQGLEELDVDQVLEQAAVHVTTKGEWEKGVISPSLVSVECRLQRLKRFLGHDPWPGQPRFMGTRAGRHDSISVINMTRGFLAEGVLVAALRQSLGKRVLFHAPTFAPRFIDPRTGMIFAGHPDMLVIGDYDEPELIQFKCPSVFKLDRVEKLGHGDALKTYLPQMATELYITRNHPRLQPVRNNLALFSWEMTVKHTKPRIIVVPLDWDNSLASIPETVADELEADVINAREFNIWPEALPEHQWDTFPCSYCMYSRLGDYTVEPNLPKCEHHEAWKKE